MVRLTTALVALGLAGSALPSTAAYQFASVDGGKITIVSTGGSTTFHLDATSGTEPAFHPAHLGVFSPAEGHRLRLDGFAARTLESGGHAIFSASVHYRVRPETTPDGPFTSAPWNTFEQVDPGTKIHSVTGLGLDLLDGLVPGRYALDVYLSAQGNFSPDLLLDRGGAFYTATFDVTPSVLTDSSVGFTANGKTLLSFTTTTNVGFGNEVYVVGSHPDVGSWNPVDAVKMTWTPGNIWTGRIAVTSGTALQYKMIVRSNDRFQVCDPGNTTWPAGDNRFVSVPGLPAPPYADKTIFCHSTWTNLSVVYRSGSDASDSVVPMTRVGDGRAPGESLYRADGVGRPGEWLTFVITGMVNGAAQTHAPAGTGTNEYATPLDVIFLQDGQVYNYRPAAAGSASRIESTFIASPDAPTIPSRTLRIYLPRDYDQNPWKQYPVLYFHDGQNVFDPGGPFGAWSAEHAADDLIRLGQMRETILVGVENTSERLREYIPDGDNPGFGPGTASLYADYLLNQVKPYVDAAYRTLPAPEHTAVVGSSLGGLVSAYLGLTTSAFGNVGAMSPSFWAAPNFVASAIDAGDTLGIRILLDAGTDELSMWDPLWNINNLLIEDGYTHNQDLLVRFGCGQGHNEAAWAARLPEVYRYLLDIRLEPNRLAQQTFPPVIGEAGLSGPIVAVEHPTLFGHHYILEHAASPLAAEWTGAVTSAVESLQHAIRTLEDADPPPPHRVYRLRTEP